MYYHQQTNQSQQNIEQTKVIQEVYSPDVSKLNDAVMNRKQGNQIHISPKKKNKKKENGFIALAKSSYQSIDCIMKRGKSIHQFYKKFFICLKMTTEKKQSLDERSCLVSYITDSSRQLQLCLTKIYVGQSAMCI